VELLDGDICAEGDTTNDYYAEITASEDRSAKISCINDSSYDLYGQNMAIESVAAADAVTQSSGDGQVVRSSSYEDIYVGTKLPGDEPPDDKDDVIDVSNVGDRFVPRPAYASLRKQSGGRSSSFETLYEMQRREAMFAGDRNEMENDGENICMQHWQTTDSCEDLSEKDCVLESMSSLIWDAQKSSPIDITVESGLDRVGQSAEYSSYTMKRSAHLLQQSVSYDLGPGKRHHKLSSGSSLDASDDGIEFQSGVNTTSGIRNGCCCTV